MDLSFLTQPSPLNCMFPKGPEDNLHKGLEKQIYKERVSMFESTLGWGYNRAVK